MPKNSSDSRAAANRQNARASTGPVTHAGKAASSRNATVHGVLSKRLLLPDESPDEYRALLEALMAEMQPVGTLEQLLVERVAVAVWRQRRLVGAETASTSERQSRITSSSLYRVLALAHLPEDRKHWVQSLLAGPLTEEDIAVEIASLEKQPLTPELAQQIEDLQEILRVLSAARTVRSAMAAPDKSDVLSRYQAALDNEWYKSLRALREAQRFRLDHQVLQAAETATPN